MKYKFKLLTLALLLTFGAKFNSVFGQASAATNNLTGTAPDPAEYLGSASTYPYNIEFKGNGTLFMKLLQSNGNLGLSSPTNWTGGFSPNFRLDVDAGDINLNTFTNAYRIGDGAGLTSYPVLWHNGDITSIFVGVGAGISSPASPGTPCNNTLVGNSAGTFINPALGLGINNTAVGLEALYTNVDANNNTAIGAWALHEIQHPIIDDNQPAADNTAVGVRALYYNYAYGCCALGFQAGEGNKYGCSLVAIGEQAALLSADGNNNMAIGEAALMKNAYLSENVAIGKTALQELSFDPTGTFTCIDPEHGCVSSYNVAVGNGALYFTDPSSETGGILNDGKNNAAIGHHAGFGNKTGNDNSFVGFESGLGNTYKGYNTFIGCSTSVVTGLEFNSTAIGYQATVPFHDQMILGNDSVHVGIGLSGDINTTPGIGPGPQNKLEINAGVYGATAPRGFDPPSAGDPGVSGLRLRDMTNICSTEHNLGPGVLSVNDHGDIIYVPGLGGALAFNGTSLDATTSQIQLGHDYPGGAGADLVNDREIPMGDNDIYFTEPGSPAGLKNNIGIGIGTSVDSRIRVYKATLSNLNLAIAGNFSARCGLGNIIDIGNGVRSEAIETGGKCGQLIGGKFIGKGSTKAGTYGVHGFGYRPDGGNVWGGYFEAVAPATHAGIAFTIGVEGFTQTPVAGSIHYAVFGDLGIVGPFPPPCVGLPCAPVTFPDAAGYFNGDMVSTTSFFSLSDGSFKNNIQDIENPMDIINQLSPKSYTFNHEQYPSMQMPTGSHYGLISQEVQNILPGLVKDCVHPPRYDSLGNETQPAIDFKALNYTELIPFLIAGMKEQQQTIEAMQAQLDNCCSAGNRQINSNDDGEQGNSLDVELQNAKAIILNQNVPNPFAEQTTITYFITDNVNKAQIFFYDNKGVILKIVDINEKGLGRLNVFAADLSSGSYTYSLIADGKLIETKKMVKQN